MSKVIITSAKILDKGTKVVISYDRVEPDGSKTECEETHKSPPHEDLLKAFKALVPHFTIIAEYIPASDEIDWKKPEHEEFEKMHVTGYNVTDDDKKHGVVLSGQRALALGRSGINTPFIHFSTDEKESNYAFADELEAAIGHCSDEVVKYLNGDKRAPDQQLKLPLQPPDEMVNPAVSTLRKVDSIDELADSLPAPVPDEQPKQKRKQKTKEVQS